jgi:DNA-binding response OmpR family regulator
MNRVKQVGLIGGGMSPKVLIVDDETYIRLLIEQTLEEIEEEGVTLLTADNGQDALDIIQAERPNLVFLDVMMPKLSGFEVCETVKQKWKIQDVYIVLLTAKGQEFDRRQGELAGANLYLTKPFDPDELASLARSVLEL